MNNGRRIQVPWELLVLFGIGIAIIVATAAMILLYYVQWPQCWWNWLFTGGILDGSNYLLSATAQVLGALFALVFSITLIAVQFVTKYTHRTMKIIFDWKLFFYMGGFACSVILPLWWLLCPTKMGTYTSLVIGSLVVLSLILLFRDLKKRMSFEWMINYFKGEGIKAVGDKDFITAEETVTTLDIIGMGAYSNNDIDVLGLAEKALAEFALGVEQKAKALGHTTPSGTLDRKSQEYRLHQFAFNILRTTCEKTIDDPRAPLIIIRNLGVVGFKAIKENLLATENAARNTIVNIAKLCDRDTRIRLSIQCFTSLYWMLKALKDTGKDKSAQEHLIGKLLFIYDIHLDKGWRDWLHFLSESVIEFIPEFQLFDSLEICQKIFKRVWITAARLESKESLQRLGRYLWDTEVIEHLIADDKPFQDAIAKGETLGIKKEIFCQRWKLLSKFSRAKPSPLPPCS